MKLYYPVKPRLVSQSFGQNALPLYAQLGMKGHNGIDFPVAEGTPVYASHSGTVTYSGLDGANGKLCVIKSDETFVYNNVISYFKTLYCHLSEFVVLAGTDVEMGQLIAYSGNTGASTGPHLHFGVKPILQGEQDWVWYNLVQDNGYNGAIDAQPYLPGMYDSKLFACDECSNLVKVSNLWKAFARGLQQLILVGGSGEAIKNLTIATAERSVEINKE